MTSPVQSGFSAPQRRALVASGVISGALTLWLTGAAVAAVLPEQAPTAPASAPVPTLAEAPKLADAKAVLPHRALYKMSLDSVRNGANVTGADGIMYFEWSDACSGWVVDQRMDVTFTHDDGESVPVGTAFSTWEAKDGTRYRFSYRRTVNGTPSEVLRGHASVPQLGQAGVATYQGEKTRDVALPAGTLFPTSHTLAMLYAAESGSTLFNAMMFDGTDEAGLSEISAVISKAKPVQNAEARKGWQSKDTAKGYPIRMAFFSAPPADSEGEISDAPDYEMDTALLSNGVSEFMTIDYGDFRMKGVLQKIELLPAVKCGN